jgi:hypothetical protein
MTLGEFRRDIRLLLGEAHLEGANPALRDPLMLDSAIYAAADEAARLTDCFQSSWTLNIDGSPTAMGLFCVDGLYRLTSALVTLSTGTKKVLTHSNGGILSRRAMDMRSPTWQTTPLSGEPSWLVVELPNLQLYPNPDYDQTGGLVLYGFGVPGTSWSGSTDTPTTECPLPSIAHQLAYWLAVRRRCIQFPTPDNMARLPLIQEMIDTQQGLTARSAAQFVSEGARGGYSL